MSSLGDALDRAGLGQYAQKLRDLHASSVEHLLELDARTEAALLDHLRLFPGHRQRWEAWLETMRSRQAAELASSGCFSTNPRPSAEQQRRWRQSLTLLRRSAAAANRGRDSHWTQPSQPAGFTTTTYVRVVRVGTHGDRMLDFDAAGGMPLPDAVAESRAQLRARACDELDAIKAAKAHRLALAAVARARAPASGSDALAAATRARQRAAARAAAAPSMAPSRGRHQSGSVGEADNPTLSGGSPMTESAMVAEDAAGAQETASDAATAEDTQAPSAEAREAGATLGGELLLEQMESREAIDEGHGEEAVPHLEGDAPSEWQLAEDAALVDGEMDLLDAGTRTQGVAADTDDSATQAVAADTDDGATQAVAADTDDGATQAVAADADDSATQAVAADADDGATQAAAGDADDGATQAVAGDADDGAIRSVAANVDDDAAQGVAADGGAPLDDGAMEAVAADSDAIGSSADPGGPSAPVAPWRRPAGRDAAESTRGGSTHAKAYKAELASRYGKQASYRSVHAKPLAGGRVTVNGGLAATSLASARGRTQRTGGRGQSAACRGRKRRSENDAPAGASTDGGVGAVSRRAMCETLDGTALVAAVLQSEDPWSLLSLGSDTPLGPGSEDEARRAYVKLAARVHPDKLDGLQPSTEAFQLLVHAYEVCGGKAERLAEPCDSDGGQDSATHPPTAPDEGSQASTRHAAAARLQASARMQLARHEYAGVTSATMRMQAAARGRLARRHVQLLRNARALEAERFEQQRVRADERRESERQRAARAEQREQYHRERAIAYVRRERMRAAAI